MIAGGAIVPPGDKSITQPVPRLQIEITTLVHLHSSLLVAYLALFPGLFALCLAWLHSRLGMRAVMLAPAVWVTTELGRTYFWSGFPWLLLGYSQTTVLPVAQAASVVGVFGVSALVAPSPTPPGRAPSGRCRARSRAARRRGTRGRAR